MVEDDDAYQSRISEQKAAEAFPEDHEQTLNEEAEEEVAWT